MEPLCVQSSSVYQRSPTALKPWQSLRRASQVAADSHLLVRTDHDVDPSLHQILASSRPSLTVSDEVSDDQLKVQINHLRPVC